MRVYVKRVEVVAAVLIHNGLVFATQRGYGEFKDGWEFPGGKVEAGRARKKRSAVRSVRSWRLRSMSVTLSIPSSTITRLSTSP